MPAIRKNNKGLRLLLALWAKHTPLTVWHEEWVRRNTHIPQAFQKQDTLYYDGQGQNNIYLVVEGLIARVQYDADTDRRKILGIGLPGMAMMTTNHLYSSTPSKGDIMVLRSKSIVVRIPYRAIRDFKEQEPAIHTLADILTNRKKKQLMALHRITLESAPRKRYLQFMEEMPSLRQILSNQECADLLGISLSTVKRSHRQWLKR